MKHFCQNEYVVNAPILRTRLRCNNVYFLGDFNGLEGCAGLGEVCLDEEDVGCGLAGGLRGGLLGPAALAILLS